MLMSKLPVGSWDSGLLGTLWETVWDVSQNHPAGGQRVCDICLWTSIPTGWSLASVVLKYPAFPGHTWVRQSKLLLCPRKPQTERKDSPLNVDDCQEAGNCSCRWNQVGRGIWDINSILDITGNKFDRPWDSSGHRSKGYELANCTQKIWMPTIIFLSI